MYKLHQHLSNGYDRSGSKRHIVGDMSEANFQHGGKLIHYHRAYLNKLDQFK